MKKDHMLQFSSMLNQALDVVVFTGAGMSTESGIPDFRGPQGVWKTQQLIKSQIIPQGIIAKIMRDLALVNRSLVQR